MKHNSVSKLVSSKSYQTNSILTIIIISVVVLLAYSSKFSNQLVWDDHEFIEEDPSIRHLANLPSFFTQPVVSLYRPLRTTLYAVSYALWGTEPAGYHAVGLSLHFFCVLALYFLMMRLGISKTISLSAALLFAVHPVHTESVTFITASFDLLGPLFFLLALTFYFGEGHPRAAAWIFFALALLSSEMTITLPLLTFLISVAARREKVSSALLKTLPFFLIAAVYLAIRFELLGIGARDTRYLGGSFWTTLWTLPRVGIEYLRLLFFPFQLIADYRHFPLIGSGLHPSFWLSALFLVATTITLWLKRRNWPWAFLGWLWLWIALLPVSNLIPIGNVMAERYLYLPSLGLSFLLADFLSRPRKIKFYATGSALALFAILTFMRNFDWKDDLTLWTQTALAAPESYVAHNNLGSNYMHKELFNSAYDEMMEALKLKPDFTDAHTNLGALYQKRGMLEPAQQAYLAAITINPNHAAAHLNLGNIYLQEGKRAEALQEYRRSVEINPRFYMGYYNLGNVFFEEGKLEEAEQNYKKAIEIQPRFEEAQYNLKVLYARQRNAASISSSASPQ